MVLRRFIDERLLRQIEAVPDKFLKETRLRRIQLDFDALLSCSRERSKLIERINANQEIAQQIGRSTAETLKIKEETQNLRKSLSELDDRLMPVLDQIPNESAPDVPKESQVIETINEDRQYGVCDHLNLAGHMIESANKAVGSQFYYLKGDAALFEQRLISFVTEISINRGYSLVKPPDLVRGDVIWGSGYNPRDTDQPYKIEGQDLYLTATSEISLLGMLAAMKAPIEPPLRFVAWSHCFRREAGHYGKQAKGLFRVHQFSKAELFTVCEAGKSEEELDRIVNLQREVIRSLGLKARLVLLPHYELGAAARKKLDWEAWFPSRKNNWGEITSASDCGTFQTRRLGIRDRHGNELSAVNGTGAAVSRLLQACIETGYDGKHIVWPSCLKMEKSLVS